MTRIKGRGKGERKKKKGGKEEGERSLRSLKRLIKGRKGETLGGRKGRGERKKKRKRKKKGEDRT